MTVLDRVPVEAITMKARRVDVGRVLLAVLAFLPMALGWAAKAVWVGVKAVGFAGAFLWSAVQVGWESGPRSHRSGEGG